MYRIWIRTRFGYRWEYTQNWEWESIPFLIRDAKKLKLQFIPDGL